MSVNTNTNIHFSAEDVNVDLSHDGEDPRAFYIRAWFGRSILFPRDLAAVDALIAGLTEARARLAKVNP